MINSVPYFTLISKYYMIHRVRFMVQFDMIDKINNEWFKGGTSKITTVLDHNKKVLGRNFSGGQIEYFI